jgi:hypothetical protein
VAGRRRCGRACALKLGDIFLPERRQLGHYFLAQRRDPFFLFLDFFIGQGSPWG